MLSRSLCQGLAQGLASELIKTENESGRIRIYTQILLGINKNARAFREARRVSQPLELWRSTLLCPL